MSEKKHALLVGTFILTVTGFASRIIGFFYRIFLSHAIGAEGMGIYQLIFPIYALCVTFTCSGIQTIISRLVATKSILQDTCAMKKILRAGLTLSLFLSLLTSVLLYLQAEWIASAVLQEIRCIPLLRLLALSIPCSCIHSCISGYYYGCKKTGIPAISQLLEQIIRVSGVYLISIILTENGKSISPDIAVIGIFIGEAASSLFCMTAISSSFASSASCRPSIQSGLFYLKQIVAQAAPLTGNRLLVNILQSAEAILIPQALKLYGLSSSDALSVYGIFTGMALPFILFPSAITNSVSVMLLPTVAEAQEKDNSNMITGTIERTIKYSLLLGILCTGIFLVFGYQFGNLIFSNSLAGKFMVTLAWICPFLYLTSTLGSIIHGLGKTTTTLIHNVIGLLIRIVFVIFIIPKSGILGYLWGLLASQLVIAALAIYYLHHLYPFRFDCINLIVKPVFSMIISIYLSSYALRLFNTCFETISLFTVGISCVIFLAVYGSALLIFGLLSLTNPSKERQK